MNNTAIQVAEEKIEGMRSAVAALEIKDEGGLAKSSDILANVKRLGTFLKQERAKLIDPAKAIIDEAKKKYDPFLAECQEAERAIKGKVAGYIDAKEKAATKQAAGIEARVEKGTMKPETAAAKMAAIEKPAATVATASSAITTSKVAKATIVDGDQIPDEFWIIDEVAVRKEALRRHKAGEEQIPGVKVEVVNQISSR